MYIFNSRNVEYKDKVRAVAVDEKVKLRLILPRSMSCSGAFLCVHKENEQEVKYSMFWAGMCGDDNAIVHDNKLQKTVVNTGKMKDANLEKGKAYLQKLYDYISEL